jgi:transposase-like protein
LAPDVLYDWFCSEAVGTPARVLVTIADVAQELGVPRSQVERAERDLRDRGLIERGAKRHNSWVELPHFRPFKNQQRTRGRAVPAATPKTDDGAAQCKEQACTGETPHTATAVCPPPTPPIAGATPEAPRNYREAVLRVLAKLPRADWRTVCDTCESLGFDNAAAVRQWYEWAKNQKRYAREREKIQQYTPKELAKQLAIADKKATRVQGQCREKPTELELKQKPYWLWRWSELLTEQERREEAQPTPEPEPVPEPAPELPEGWRLVRCDHTGYVPDHQIAPYWRAVHADGAMTEPSQYADSAVRLACAAQAREREGGAT